MTVMIRAKNSITLGLVAIVVALVPIRQARALSIFGCNADAEEIIAAIVALNTAVTDLQKSGNAVVGDIKSIDEEMARDLGDGQFTDLISALTTAQDKLRDLNAEVERIGYTESTIRTQFERVFPKDAAAWKDIRYSDYDGLFSNWHSEIVASSTAAAHAQVSLNDVRSSNERAAEILARAQNNHSEIQQLQTQNQMLAVVQNNLGSILQSLTSQGRIVSEATAIAASEKQAMRTTAQARVEHYGDPHSSSTVLSRMPPVQGN